MSDFDPQVMNKAAELLQNLIRFDTTNPPGNEVQCVSYINSLLTDAGFETTILARDSNRPNLIARLKGRGTAAPLLLYGHVDVVSTANQSWTHPPFEGKMIDGYIWGRGALDMKGGVAMMLAAFLRAKAEGLTPAGDIVLAILSDEETGGDYGANYLVENHAEQFEGIRYAIGEFGGFPMYIGQQKFYAIQVADKCYCWMKVILRGPGGHASTPVRSGVMARLAKLLQSLDQHRLPVHVTPVARQMLESIAAAIPSPMNSAFLQLLDPALTDTVLDQLGLQGLMFDAMLHNTVNATVVQGGEKINVIPGEIILKLDGRLLPGYTFDDMVAELRPIIGDDIELEIIRYDPTILEPDMGLLDTLASILRKADPDAIPVPLLLTATTDAKHFSRLGIQTYGFIPMNLPEEFILFNLIHAADERIPVEAVNFGANAIYEALQLCGE
ncbi:MAG: peptidase M20 [Dehalococcoidales bacterium]|jgi:acetylornithine deacetylase/succinyl-diaminopimelate desuccinylase-like protein|nr:peptidase M20 [Dehalococcoidales bacterium]|tara:strand:- start:94 stop:1419 length:1326 start_codon:yes stop_codon:yes gene_type:complete